MRNSSSLVYGNIETTDSVESGAHDNIPDGNECRCQTMLRVSNWSTQIYFSSSVTKAHNILYSFSNPFLGTTQCQNNVDKSSCPGKQHVVLAGFELTRDQHRKPDALPTDYAALFQYQLYQFVLFFLSRPTIH